jgi:hypothetical protein
VVSSVSTQKLTFSAGFVQNEPVLRSNTAAL